MATQHRRTLGKLEATLFTAAMIVGTGLFTSLGAATSHAGSGILIAMLVGGLIALSTGVSAAQVGVNYPEEGGAFIWNRKFGYPTLSFVAGCAYLFDGIIGLGILALGFATYSAQLVPWLPIRPTATVAVLAVAIVNFFGISPTAKILIGVLAINVVLLGVYVGFAAPAVHAAHLTPVLGPSIGGVLSGAATFFWTWDGFQRTAIMADEIKEPRKTIPFAVVGGISIAALIYLVVAATTLGVLGPDALGKSDAPLFVGAKVGIALWAAWMILASSWISAFSEMLGDLLATSRVGHAMGEAKELPHWLAALHKRFHSPHHSLVVLAIIGVALINLVPLRALMPVASACTLVWYAATHFAALQLRKDQRFAPIAISWLGIAGCLGLFASLPVWSIGAASGSLALWTGIRWVLRARGERAVSRDRCPKARP